MHAITHLKQRGAEKEVLFLVVGFFRKSPTGRARSREQGADEKPML
jgi:hypothetical protein